MDHLACVLHYLCATEPSDSLLMHHLLAYWRPVWRPCYFGPRTCVQGIGGARVRDLALKEISLYLQVEASFDSDEAKKCLGWMKAVGVVDADESQCSHDAFYTHLRDGNILCK